MREEAVDRIRGLDLEKAAEDVKAMVATHKNQLNFAYLMYHLPRAIQMAKDNLERKEANVAKMKATQEGGTI